MLTRGRADSKKNTPGLSQVSPKGILTSSHRRKRCIMGRLETPKSVYRACVELWFLCVVLHLHPIGQSLESSSGSDCQEFGEAQCSRGENPAADKIREISRRSRRRQLDWEQAWLDSFKLRGWKEGSFYHHHLTSQTCRALLQPEAFAQSVVRLTCPSLSA